MTFAEIKTNIQTDLDDTAAAFFSSNDVDVSMQDAYNDVAAKTGCIVKKSAGLSWEANRSYYDFKSLVSDFLGVLAIYNNGSNLWLEDNQNLKQFDKIRSNWETWTGAPRYWASVNFKWNAICPKYAAAGETFDLYYSALAPAIVSTNSPLIVADMQDLIELYVKGDLLEQAEEFKKAQIYWFGDENLQIEGYFSRIQSYQERIQNIAKADLLRLA